MEDKELEKCKKIDEVIDIINSRKEEYLSYKENIDIHFKDNTNFPSEKGTYSSLLFLLKSFLI